MPRSLGSHLNLVTCAYPGAQAQLQGRTLEFPPFPCHLIPEGVTEILIGCGSVVIEVWGELLVNRDLHAHFRLQSTEL